MKTSKKLLSLLLAALMVFSFLPTVAFASEDDVAKIDENEYATLAEAVAAAQANDTITLLADVTLSASVTIEKNITLDGNGKKIDILSGFTGDGILYLTTTNGATIKNVKFEGLSNLKNDAAAIFIGDGSIATGTKESPIIIENCTFKGAESVNDANQAIGVLSTGYQHEYIDIEGCTFTNMKYAMYFNHASNLNIIGNIIDGTKYNGINIADNSVRSCDNIVIKNNTLKNISAANYEGDTYSSGVSFGNNVKNATMDGNKITMLNSKKSVYVNDGGALSITGGTFSDKVDEEYIANGYICTGSGSTWTVCTEGGVVIPPVEPEDVFDEETDLDETEQAEIIEELVKNPAIVDNDVSEVEGVETLTIELEAVVAAKADGTVTVSKITYDVTPKDASGEDVTEPDAPITFNLPLTKGFAAVGDYVKVTHKGDPDEVSYVQVRETESKDLYITLTFDHFSEVEITNNGDAVAVIGDMGYTTLAEAVAAVKSGETITLLQDIKEDKITVGRRVTFTIDLDEYKLNADINPGEDYMVFEEQEEEDELSITVKSSVYKRSQETAEGAVAKIEKGGEIYYYSSLANAVSDAQNNDTITLLKDSETVTITVSRVVTFKINFNGKTLNATIKAGEGLDMKCTSEDGQTEYNVHAPVDADPKDHVCDICGKTISNHVDTEPKDHLCDICKDQISDHKGVYQKGLEPTYRSAGYRGYYECECGKYFEDRFCTREITDLAKWQAKGGNGYLAKLKKASSDPIVIGKKDAETSKQETNPETGAPALDMAAGAMLLAGAALIALNKKRK